MPIFAPRSHVFVDESKSRGYFVAAAAAAPNRVQELDRGMRSLTRKGQRRIHFTSESDSSRRSLISRMCELDVSVQLYVVRGESDREARTKCLQALITDVANSGVSRLVLERDDSLMVSDRRTIRQALETLNCRDRLRYEHVSPQEQSLLWVSDAVAWCHQAGGDWVRRASPLVGGITHLS